MTQKAPPFPSVVSEKSEGYSQKSGRTPDAATSQGSSRPRYPKVPKPDPVPNAPLTIRRGF